MRYTTAPARARGFSGSGTKLVKVSVLRSNRLRPPRVPIHTLPSWASISDQMLLSIRLLGLLDSLRYRRNWPFSGLYTFSPPGSVPIQISPSWVSSRAKVLLLLRLFSLVGSWRKVVKV